MNLDQLASGLASGTITRRRALAAIGAGALGALMPWASRAEAQPGCRREGHPCEGNQDCCPTLECVEAAGPGQAARCVKKEEPKECPRNAKECKEYPKGKCPDTHQCKKCKVIKKDKECKDDSKCDKGCKCEHTKNGKKFCVCEKEVCVPKKKRS